MRFLVTLDLNNAAFDHPDRSFTLADVLRGIAQRVESQDIAPPPAGMKTLFASVRDDNGNTIGNATYADDDYYVAEVQHPGFIRDWRKK